MIIRMTWWYDDMMTWWQGALQTIDRMVYLNTYRRFSLGPAGSCLSHFWQLVRLCLTCLFYSLRHGRLRLIEVFHLIIKVFTFIIKVIPFGHQGHSLWSPRSFHLVTKVFPLVTKDQASSPPFTFFLSEVWLTKYLRTGRNREPCKLLD